jgi:hypothetical protein
MSDDETFDIVQYDKDVFVSLKTIPSTEKDVELVNKLFETYDCFSNDLFDKDQPADKEWNKRGPPPWHTKRHQSSYNHRSGQAPIRRNRQLTFEEKFRREMQSMLNKITEHTKTSLTERILEMVNAHNIDYALTILIHTSYTQESYMMFYCDVIKLLHHKLGEEAPLSFDNAFSQLIEDYFEKIEGLEIASDILTINDYDLFCAYVKHKKTCLGKNFLITFAIKHGVSKELSLHGWIHRHQALLAEKCFNNPSIELGVRLIQQIFKQLPKQFDAEQKQYIDLYENTLSHRITFKKVTFIIHDFIENLFSIRNNESQACAAH